MPQTSKAKSGGCNVTCEVSGPDSGEPPPAVTEPRVSETGDEDPINTFTIIKSPNDYKTYRSAANTLVNIIIITSTIMDYCYFEFWWKFI